MLKEDGGSEMKKVKIGQEMHFEFKGTLGEFLDKIDEYFGLKDLSKKVNAVIDIQDDEKEV